MEKLKFNNKLDFNITKIYKNNKNLIILYTNKYNIDLKLEELNIERYTYRLIFNFIFDIATTI